VLLHAGLQQLRREHGPLADGIQVLLGALPGVKAEMPGHAVLSADWYWPTGHSATGGAAIPDPEAAARHHRLIEGRQTAEADCLAAFSARHALLREFTELVQVTRHYTVIR